MPANATKIVPSPDDVPPPPAAEFQRLPKPGFRFSCCTFEKGLVGVNCIGGGGYPMGQSEVMQQQLQQRNVIPIGAGEADVPKGIFDAHVHLLDFSQHTEGIGFLLKAMDENGISHAAIMGCPLKKNWSEFEDRMSPDAVNDTDLLYYFSLTDLHLMDELRTLPPNSAARFRPLLCGFKPSDKSAPEHIDGLIDRHPEIMWSGLGKIYTRGCELTNLTAGPVPHPGNPAFDLIMGEATNRNLPVLIQHNACASSSKPYKYGFEFVEELKEVLGDFPKVDMLWVGAGYFARGQWVGYKEVLDGLLTDFSNLFLSVTGEILSYPHVKRAELVELAEKHPTRFLVGTSTLGAFTKQDEYKNEWGIIKQFLGALTRETYKKVRYENAAKMYKQRMNRATMFHVEATKQTNWLQKTVVTKNEALHNVEEARKKDKAPPAEKNRSLEGMKDGKLVHDSEIKYVTIDTHLHMLDFLQKSSGTRTILEAMDGCGVEKAIIIGMPCCKKWSKDEPERPLYYQDDNGQCYFYAYSDQMVADAWLALPTEKRARLAPIMGAFNPTDLHAIDHVQRMWDKYPGMWRGLGEVMCRHDDLTMLLQEEETPVINHIGMRALYEFCIEHDINCLVHHNATRTAMRDKGGHYEYLWEVKQVLDEFPTLRLIWCHAGASRRTHEDHHHEMIDEMLTQYPQLIIDMSWVVWEDVVVEPGTGKPRKGWIALFGKHPTRFTIGSDQVGQFINPAGGNLLKPEITKYWVLGDCGLPDETVKAILYGNAQRIWFEGWDMPTPETKRFGQIEPCMRAETLHHNEGAFIWDNKEMY